jgi:hypothetical protein
MVKVDDKIRAIFRKGICLFYAFPISIYYSVTVKNFIVCALA